MSLRIQSRRKPYPYDIVVGTTDGHGGVGMMLLPGEQYIFGSQRAAPLDAQPTDYTYGSANPFLERTYPYDRLVLGMGQALQEQTEEARYFYAQNADLSVNGLWQKGPRFQTQTVCPGLAIGPMTVARYQNIESVYVAAGERLYVRIQGDSADAWTGQATGGTTTTLTQAGASWAPNRWAGFAVEITAGTGVGQARLISSHTADTLTVSPAWTTAPDASSQFLITPYLKVLDTGGGNRITQLARFKDADPNNPRDALYVATANGRCWQVRGTVSFTDPSFSLELTASGQALAVLGRQAQAIYAVDDELYYAWGNLLSKVEADPTVAANHSGVLRIGDAAQPIIWLAANHGVLYIFKRNGIFVLDQELNGRELFPGLRVEPSDDNGRGATPWLDYLWIPYRDTLYKLAPNGQLEPVGTERMLDNSSPIRGQVVGFAGHQTWFGYVLLCDQRQAQSFLLKLGSWVEREGQGQPLGSVLAEVYHGALASWPKRATSLQIVPINTDRAHLYVGFKDGTLAWCRLPRYSPHPARDPDFEYTADDAEVILPAHHGGFQADVKIVRGFSVFGLKLSDDAWVELDYTTDDAAAAAGAYRPLLLSYDPTVRRDAAGNLDGVTLTDPSANFTQDDVGRIIAVAGVERSIKQVFGPTQLQLTGAPLGTFTATPYKIFASRVARFTQSGQRIDLPRELAVHGKLVYVRVRLLSTSTTASPILTGVALHLQLHPAYIREYQFTVMAWNELARRDGRVDRRKAETIRQVLHDAVSNPLPVECWLPNGEREFVTFIDIEERLRANERRAGHEWDIAVRGIQYKTVDPPGTYVNLTGLTYDDLEQYDYEQLESIIV